MIHLSLSEKKAFAERYARFRIAAVLAGHGSTGRLAADLDVSVTTLLRAVRRKMDKHGYSHPSERLEIAAERFIDEQAEKHRDFLYRMARHGQAT